MFKKAVLLFVIIILAIFFWHYFTVVKMEVNLEDVEIRVNNNWRGFREEYQENHFFVVDAMFQLHNPNQREIQVCVIQLPKELQRLSKEIFDFNVEYAYRFSSGETVKKWITFVFSEQDISKEEVINLISQSTFVAYSNDNYWGNTIYDQLQNHWKAPFIEYIFGYGKSRVKNCIENKNI